LHDTSARWLGGHSSLLYGGHATDTL
jgi:hypothetical protein